MTLVASSIEIRCETCELFEAAPATPMRRAMSDRQEREALRTARRRIRQMHEAGFDSRRREIATDAICEIDAALAASEEPQGWKPPNSDRVPIMIHPEARTALRNLLYNHPHFSSSGIGYSEFIMRCVAAREDTERPDAR